MNEHETESEFELERTSGGKLLTVEETVEETVETKPTPRRRPTRARAAAETPDASPEAREPETEMIPLTAETPTETNAPIVVAAPAAEREGDAPVSPAATPDST